jgi:hypothetical protein
MPDLLLQASEGRFQQQQEKVAVYKVSWAKLVSDEIMYCPETFNTHVSCKSQNGGRLAHKRAHVIISICEVELEWLQSHIR